MCGIGLTRGYSESGRLTVGGVGWPVGVGSGSGSGSGFGSVRFGSVREVRDRVGIGIGGLGDWDGCIHRT